jgi:glucosamine--fructose-6-phosphate aminotransferase (isomerizing)
MSETPELRAGPPWAMEEMIAAEPGLAEPVLTAPAADELAAAIAAAVAAGEPVRIVGCGTSEHAAMAGAAMLREALRSDAVDSRDAFEASLDPQRGGVVVAVSHEAGTPATLAAARAAAASGARVALITARPEGVPEPSGGEGFARDSGALVLATPLVDRSWCHTVGYVSPLLAFAGVAARLAGGAPDPDAARAAIEAWSARREELRESAARLAGCERLLAVGSGADEITARELALKIEEGTHVPVTPLGLEKLLHGHLPAADARTGVVLLRLDPRAAERRDARATEAVAAVAALGMPTVRIAAGPPAGLSPAVGALLSGALAAQLLTLELVHALGTNPDLIRREEAPYRAAAAIAEAG